MIPKKRRPIFLGLEHETNEELYLSRKWLQTHIHVMGPPGAGKTRLLLWLFSRLAEEEDATLILINPKGALYRMARDIAIADGHEKRLVLFDPADEKAIIGYNPLAPNGLAVETHAKAVREAIRAAWGQASFDQTAQLARLLFLVLAVARELRLTLVDAVQLLRPRSLLRRRSLRLLSAGPLRDALCYFDSLSETRQEELAASTLARLEPFAFDGTIRRIVAQQNRALSLGDVIDKRKILLINLEQFRPLRTDDVKLLGRLLVNDILAHVFARPEGERSPVYLILDEVQTLATQDLATTLDQGRELGLHCLLANQFPDQLLEEDQSGRLRSSVMNCARTKILFGGLSVSALEELTKEFYIDEFDPYAIKDEIRHLELEPVESRRTVLGASLSFGTSSMKATGRSRSGSHQKGWSHAHGMSHTDGGSITSGTALSDFSGSGTGISVTPEGDVIQSVNAMNGSGHSSSESSTQSYSTSNSEVDSESESTGQQIGEQLSNGTGQTIGFSLSSTVVPFYEYKKHRVVSSRTFVSEEEFLTVSLQKLHQMGKGRFALKVPGKPVTLLRAPRVNEPWLSQRSLDRALTDILSQPYYSSPEQVAVEETERGKRLLMAPLADGVTIDESDTNDEVRTTKLRRPSKKIPKPPTY